MLREGDVVTVRDWDDMAAEFGTVEGKIDGSTYVNTRFLFAERMKEYCGKEMTVTYVSDFGEIHLDTDGQGWIFSEECFEGDAEKQVETEIKE